jgi:hypothetical protein
VAVSKKTLNNKEVKTKVKELEGAVLEQLDEAASEDIATLQGEYERVLDALQERHGYTRQAAQEQIAGLLEDIESLDTSIEDIAAETELLPGGKSRRRGPLLALLLAAVVIVLVLRFRRSLSL